MDTIVTTSLLMETVKIVFHFNRIIANFTDSRMLGHPRAKCVVICISVFFRLKHFSLAVQ